MNSENSKTCNPHRLLVNFSDKINLKRIDKYVALSNLKIIQSYKKINLKYQLSHGMKSFNYLMDHSLYQRFKINSIIL